MNAKLADNLGIIMYVHVIIFAYFVLKKCPIRKPPSFHLNNIIKNIIIYFPCCKSLHIFYLVQHIKVIKLIKVRWVVSVETLYLHSLMCFWGKKWRSFCKTRTALSGKFDVSVYLIKTLVCRRNVVRPIETTSLVHFTHVTLLNLEVANSDKMFI